MGPASLPLWVEIIVATLLLMSAALALAAAWGLVRLKNFFQRMHPTALVYVGASWCVTFASIIYFSALSRGPQLHVWIIIILLSITVPVTTVFLSRAALFRYRQAGSTLVPPALHPQNGTPPGDES